MKVGCTCKAFAAEANGRPPTAQRGAPCSFGLLPSLAQPRHTPRSVCAWAPLARLPCIPACSRGCGTAETTAARWVRGCPGTLCGRVRC